MASQKIAIIGTGISGLGCAHLLHREHEVTLYEAADYVGGHSNTITVDEDGTSVRFDTGFMVFNHETYPLLTRLFHDLGVETKRTDMSFSLKHDATGYEYNGKNLDTLFGQRKNLVNPRFWRFLLQIHRFNQETIEAINDPRCDALSLQEYVEARGYGKDFLDLYILPMGSAVWSTPPDQMLNFPAKTLMRFWYNHGFLGMKTRHPWWTVSEGSQQYVQKLIEPFRKNIRLKTPVQRVERSEQKVRVYVQGENVEIYDKVIFATHAPTSLRLLADPSLLEEELLSCFRYQSNVAAVHSWEKVMPQTKKCWAAWNYEMHFDKEGKVSPSTHYWMNLLQGVADKRNYFVTINPNAALPDSAIIREIEYEHPLFDVRAVAAQKRIPELHDPAHGANTYFSGAWTRYGFHEDGFMSAVAATKALLGREPW